MAYVSRETVSTVNDVLHENSSHRDRRRGGRGIYSFAVGSGVDMLKPLAIALSGAFFAYGACALGRAKYYVFPEFAPPAFTWG